jgi:hypothetical protein
LSLTALKRAKNVTSTMTLALFSKLSQPQEREVFLRTLLRNLAGILQKVVGLKVASGFISVVG